MERYRCGAHAYCHSRQQYHQRQRHAQEPPENSTESEGKFQHSAAGGDQINNLVCGNTQGQISSQVLDAADSGNFTPLGIEGMGVGALPGCELPANLFDNKNGLDNLPNSADDDFSLKPNSLAIDVGMDPRTLGFNPSYFPIFEADFVIEGVRPSDGNSAILRPAPLNLPILWRRFTAGHHRPDGAHVRGTAVGTGDR
jgi:hypothetical protein